MILRGRYRRRQMVKTKFLQTWKEALLLLAAEDPEYELARILRSPSRHHNEDETGETGMIELGNASPPLPFRSLRPLLRSGHFGSQMLFGFLVGFSSWPRLGEE
jgi:hypothetical protein